jgi:hypothetical protein
MDVREQISALLRVNSTSPSDCPRPPGAVKRP